MKDPEWQTFDNQALETLLVERWLIRGLMLVVILVAASATTYLGIQDASTLADRLTQGALLAITVCTGIAAFVMRFTDIRIHRELRRRRAAQGVGQSPA